MKYTYSVVIPHYNSAFLLKRMLRSIPERNDIQVIVVDDNSEDADVEVLGNLIHKNLEVYYLKENQGAGAARNIGLKYVQGNWVVVVDADDYFETKAFDRFDEEINDDYDYIMYCISYFNPETNSKEQAIGNVSNNSNLNYISNPSLEHFRFLKLKSTVCYNKLVNLKFLQKFNIHFEECEVNNDVLYAYMVSLYSNKMKLLDDALYIKELVPTSITGRKRSIEREFLFYIQAQKRNGLFELLNLKKYPFYRSDILYVVFLLHKRGLFDTIKFFKYRKKHISVVKEARSYYKHFFEGISLANLQGKMSDCVVMRKTMNDYVK